MGKYRSYSAEFKVQVVLEALKGQKTEAQICREHTIAPDLLTRLQTELAGTSTAAVCHEAAAIGRAGAHRRTGAAGRLIDNGAGCLKKSFQAAVLPLAQRREIREGLREEFPVRLLCRLLEVAPSSY